MNQMEATVCAEVSEAEAGAVLPAQPQKQPSVDVAQTTVMINVETRVSQDSAVASPSSVEQQRSNAECGKWKIKFVG